MSPRTPGLGRGPSPHDSTGPRDKGDIRRPLGAPPPDVPAHSPATSSSGCVVFILAGLALPFALGGATAYALGWLG